MSYAANIPPQLDFSKRGMCAALNMAEDEFTDAYRNKEIAPPDSVRLREPRWSVMALGQEIKKRTPAHLVGLEALNYQLEALARAERAEGWRHD